MVNITVKDGVMNVKIEGKRNEVVNELINIEKEVNKKIATNILIIKGILSGKNSVME